VAAVLRIPGHLRRRPPGRPPARRLQRGTPVLCGGDDVYTNHIHADDLARACVAALCAAGRSACCTPATTPRLKMGDYFDLAADLCGLPRPPRITRAEARSS
jgi:nucleoside-diphosphate-sugar epimerase